MMTNLEDENGLKEKINPEHLKEMKKRQEEGCPKELPSVIGEQNRTAIIDSCLLWTCEGSERETACYNNNKFLNAFN